MVTIICYWECWEVLSKKYDARSLNCLKSLITKNDFLWLNKSFVQLDLGGLACFFLLLQKRPAEIYLELSCSAHKILVSQIHKRKRLFKVHGNSQSKFRISILLLLLSRFVKRKFFPCVSYRNSANRKLFFFEFNLMYCDLWQQYIQVRKLFKRGNYSRAETIRGNTVNIFKMNLQVNLELRPKNLIYINLALPWKDRCLDKFCCTNTDWCTYYCLQRKQILPLFYQGKYDLENEYITRKSCQEF